MLRAQPQRSDVDVDLQWRASWWFPLSGERLTSSSKLANAPAVSSNGGEALAVRKVVDDAEGLLGIVEVG